MLTAIGGGRSARPLRVAVLCSRRAPGLSDLIGAEADGTSFVVAGVVTTDPRCVERERLNAAGVPLIEHDICDFYARRGVPLADLGLRREYDQATAKLVENLRADVVVLCGYLHIVTAPFLDAYPDCVINIHDSDLPRFPGLHAVRDAVFAGERVTRSTVHVATPDVDGGPSLVRSWAFPTHPLIHAARRWGATDILKAYAYAQREWMMHECWGLLLGTALELYAKDAIRRRDGRCLIDGAPGPFELYPPSARDARDDQRPWARSAAVSVAR